MNTSRLILASSSPRRQSLLREAGFKFITHPANIDEDNYPRPIRAANLARLLACQKASAVADLYPDDLVMGSDTVVVVDLPYGEEEILGKPMNPEHATAMLRKLSGTIHRVITGVALHCVNSKFHRDAVVTSTVQMRKLSDVEIADYVLTKNWEGKAGGYGIQDKDPFVTNMSGSLTNIVGLPMEATTDLLAEAGIVPS